MSDHNQNELKPCPFCGCEQGLRVALYNRPCVVCEACGADGPSAQFLSARIDNHVEVSREARELWNKRAEISVSDWGVEKALRELHDTWNRIPFNRGPRTDFFVSRANWHHLTSVVVALNKLFACMEKREDVDRRDSSGALDAATANQEPEISVSEGDKQDLGERGGQP